MATWVVVTVENVRIVEPPNKGHFGGNITCVCVCVCVCQCIEPAYIYCVVFEKTMVPCTLITACTYLTSVTGIQVGTFPPCTLSV